MLLAEAIDKPALAEPLNPTLDSGKSLILFPSYCSRSTYNPFGAYAGVRMQECELNLRIHCTCTLIQFLILKPPL
jgi:hypothetical protein